ncbi:MAG TPA: hypothetical protein VKB19_03450 [Pedobacter sp.]|nr:hypothetical protein [Pedobacter sp.]
MRKLTLLLQSTYYLMTGVWPIIDINTFMAVTGPKTDIWLVKMVALLTMVISIQLFIDIKNNHTSVRLPVLTALSFLVIDSYYALKGTISEIYLLDASIQLAFLFTLTILWRKER